MRKIKLEINIDNLLDTTIKQMGALSVVLDTCRDEESVVEEILVEDSDVHDGFLSVWCVMKEVGGERPESFLTISPMGDIVGS